MLTDRDFFVLPVDNGPLDYQSVFGNSNPVFIEIGSGKGEFISQYSMLHPDQNFLGFEVRDKRINNILKKIDPTRHLNVRIICLMVDQRITEILPAESIHGAFIQHPDPWPKKKHHKRRLVRQDFLDALAQILMPDAFVEISTDHVEYANWIAEEFVRNPNFLSLQDQLIQDRPHFNDHVITWFEQEQRRLGFDPRYLLFKKI